MQVNDASFGCSVDVNHLSFFEMLAKALQNDKNLSQFYLNNVKKKQLQTGFKVTRRSYFVRIPFLL